jgi:hypothetical protein
VSLAIQFDDQPRVVGCEIGNVCSDWHLPSKVNALGLEAAQDRPQVALGRGGGVS